MLLCIAAVSGLLVSSSTAANAQLVKGRRSASVFVLEDLAERSFHIKPASAPLQSLKAPCLPFSPVPAFCPCSPPSENALQETFDHSAYKTHPCALTHRSCCPRAAVKYPANGLLLGPTIARSEFLPLRRHRRARPPPAPRLPRISLARHPPRHAPCQVRLPRTSPCHHIRTRRSPRPRK